MWWKLIVTASAVSALLYYVLRKRTKISGITGGIAFGKSTVSKMLRGTIIDADIYRTVCIQTGFVGRRSLECNAVTSARRGDQRIERFVTRFGDGVLKADQTIDREALGKIVFADPAARRKLNSITHPEIFKQIFLQLLKSVLRVVALSHFSIDASLISFFQGDRVVYLDIPLLFESGRVLTSLCHEIAVVSVDADTQLQRLTLRNALSADEAARRCVFVLVSLFTVLHPHDHVSAVCLLRWVTRFFLRFVVCLCARVCSCVCTVLRPRCPWRRSAGVRPW